MKLLLSNTSKLKIRPWWLLIVICNCNVFTNKALRVLKNSLKHMCAFQIELEFGSWKCWFLTRGENWSNRRNPILIYTDLIDLVSMDLVHIHVSAVNWTWSKGGGSMVCLHPTHPPPIKYKVEHHARDVTVAAMLVVRSKSLSLLWLFSCKFFEKKFYSVDPPKWPPCYALQTKNYSTQLIDCYWMLSIGHSVKKKMRSYYELTLRTESPSIFVDDLSRKDRSDSASRVLWTDQDSRCYVLLTSQLQ